VSRKVLVIVGPTAVGKTALALEIASRRDSEVVSADSRQVYKYMDIGTAKPTPEELEAVPHHFIDIKRPDEYYSAGQFAGEARSCVREILDKGKLPIVVGGSGLYIRGLVDGFSAPQIADEQVKRNLRHELERDGIAILYKRLCHVDPAAGERLHPTDTQRILRALEVFEISGRPWSEWLKLEARPADFAALCVGLSMEREALYARIERRADAMISAGLVAEVERLRELGYGPEHNALRSVGYQQVLSFLEGEIDADAMLRDIKQKTRNFAKRQLTWFRKDERITWLQPPEENAVASMAAQTLKILEGLPE